VQLLGGLILNEGKIIEMQTGEGKTLVATLSAVSNTLTKKGVHIITVNDYLAKRDTEWIGQIYRFLDLSVGLVNDNLSVLQKQNNYNCDITYLTNTTLGFDFLRDNLAIERDTIVQKPFNFCIIDEIDSVLIDEAKTPLIISKPEETNVKKFFKATEVIKFLQSIKDFEIDERTRNVSLTERGFLKLKALLKVNDLYSIQKKSKNNFLSFESLEKENDYAWIYYILNALKAKYLFFKNVHYVLQYNKIIIVDESTGRLMPGRKWGEGLHEAIEIKEGLTNLKGSQNISSINYQNLFRLYPKLSGMTGTAKTDELEFQETYNLSVVVIPPHKSVKRIDLSDSIYIDDKTRWNAVCLDVAKLQKIGRPVLIGTPTIEKSDILSNLFNHYQIKHELLNARPENLKRESEIIADAGKLKSVTIATNMAGRGTDILLGGNSEFQAKKKLEEILYMLLSKGKYDFNKNFNLKKDCFFNNLLLEIQKNYLLELGIILIYFEFFFEFLIGPRKKLKKFDRLILILYQLLIKKCQKKCQKEANIIKKLGGLYVIGTERHDSRRIDNQLRGRAGRQGDPGTSRFYLSANDKLIRVFGGSQISQILKLLECKDKPFEDKFFSKLITSSQQKVESMYYEQRQNINKYDENLEKQHFFILKLRQMILNNPNLYYFTNSLIEELIDDLISHIHTINNSNKNTKDLFEIPPQFYLLLSILNVTISPFYPTLKNINNLRHFLYQQSLILYNKKETEIWSYDQNLFSEFQKLIFLAYIDLYWAEHLENMNFIKESIGWEAYAQRDPLLRYLEKSEYLFNIKLKNIRDLSLLEIFSPEDTDI
jgi:preprotein translocase subunit SecA